jgi:hypothetical protein
MGLPVLVSWPYFGESSPPGLAMERVSRTSGFIIVDLGLIVGFHLKGALVADEARNTYCLLKPPLCAPLLFDSNSQRNSCSGKEDERRGYDANPFKPPNEPSASREGRASKRSVVRAQVGHEIFWARFAEETAIANRNRRASARVRWCYLVTLLRDDGPTDWLG